MCGVCRKQCSFRRNSCNYHLMPAGTRTLRHIRSAVQRADVPAGGRQGAPTHAEVSLPWLCSAPAPAPSLTRQLRPCGFGLLHAESRCYQRRPPKHPSPPPPPQAAAGAVGSAADRCGRVGQRTRRLCGPPAEALSVGIPWGAPPPLPSSPRALAHASGVWLARPAGCQRCSIRDLPTGTHPLITPLQGYKLTCC